MSFSIRVKNEIRRNLIEYIEHRGSNKTGGYYLKESKFTK